MRVVLALTAVCFCLGMVQKTPCVLGDWEIADDVRFGALCYSDVPYAYHGSGLAERAAPFADPAPEDQDRLRPLEYPVLVGSFAYVSALITHALEGWPDLEERQALPRGEAYSAEGVPEETGTFFVVTAILLAALALLAAYFLARANRGRPYDAALFAAAPVLALTGLMNWELLAVAAVAGALWAWSRGSPRLAGVLLGVGAAAKVYPLLLLPALLLVCVRRRELPSFTRALGGAAGVWLVLNLPVMVLGYPQWKAFWVAELDRGPDLGSVWFLVQQADGPIGTATANVGSALLFLAWCVGLATVALRAPRSPRLAQVAFLVVVGFVLTATAYSPQHVLWLLPLAVLARPRWRDIGLWQATEVFYFCAVWWYLGGFTATATTDGDDLVYWLAILVRVSGQLWLAGLVVRDLMRPQHDPVRADGVTDDPLHPQVPVEPVET